MNKYLPKCENCGDEKSILHQISTELDRKYLCDDCYNTRASSFNWIERSASDGEVSGSNPDWPTKKK